LLPLFFTKMTHFLGTHRSLLGVKISF
jgi:hypothetical protein